jgi:hypothetical protein
MPTLFAVFLAIFVSQVSVNAAEKVRIGFNPGASGIYFPLAQKMGFLKEEGIEAEVIRFLVWSQWQRWPAETPTITRPFLRYGQRSKAFRLKLLLLIYKAVTRHS